MKERCMEWLAGVLAESVVNLQLQNEYVGRHVKVEDKKRKITTNAVSRRSETYHYTLPLQGNLESVCKA